MRGVNSKYTTCFELRAGCEEYWGWFSPPPPPPPPGVGIRDKSYRRELPYARRSGIVRPQIGIINARAQWLVTAPRNRRPRLLRVYVCVGGCVQVTAAEALISDAIDYSAAADRNLSRIVCVAEIARGLFDVEWGIISFRGVVELFGFAGIIGWGL